MNKSEVDWYTRFGSRLMFHGKIPKGLDGSGRRCSFTPGSLGTYVMLTNKDGVPLSVLPKTVCPNDIVAWAKYLMRNGVDQNTKSTLLTMMHSVMILFPEDIMVQRVMAESEYYSEEQVAEALIGWMEWQPRKDWVRNSDGTQEERGDCQSLAHYLQKINDSKAHVQAIPRNTRPVSKPMPVEPPAEPGKRRFTL